jgi:hypothetical protein
VTEGKAAVLVLAPPTPPPCMEGKVDCRTYPNRDQVGVVAADSPLLPDLGVAPGRHRRNAGTVHL